MGRTPTLTELGVFSVMWSEHCSYKSSRVWLKQLPTKAPWVIHGPGRERRRGRYRRRAGRHLQDGEPQPPELHRALPGRRHRRRRHPARRVHHGRAADRQPERAALRRSGHTRAPSASSTAWCAASAATATASACPRSAARSISIPPIDGNPLVNAMTVGIARKDKIFLSPRPPASAIRWSMSAPRPAATASTARPWPRAEFAADSEEKRPTVQVGDPFTEKLLIEACLELMATDAIVAIQDMGAAGLTSSSVEMAGKGGVGIELDLDMVPAARDRHDGLRVHAVGKPGAHADGRCARTAQDAGARRSSRNGTWISRSSAELTDTGRIVVAQRRGGGRHPAGAAERSGAALSPPDRRARRSRRS